MLARWLRVHPEVSSVSLEGHADDVGDAAYNLDLSLRRARAVRRRLVRFGVERARLETHGFGATQLLDPSAEQTARDINRRVDIVMEAHPAPGEAGTTSREILAPESNQP